MSLGSTITTALFPCLSFALMLAIGFLLVKIKRLDSKGIDTVIGLLVDVLLPCMVFWCVYSSGMTWSDLCSNVNVLLGSLIVFAVLLLVHLLEALIMRLKIETRYIYMLCGGFGNTGLVGIPILVGIYSADAASLKFVMLGIAIYTLADIILAYTLAPFFSKMHLKGKVADPYEGMSGGKRFLMKTKEIFSPIVIGVILGFIFCMAQIKLPTFITDIIEYSFNGAIILAGIYLGGLLAFANVSRVFKGGHKYVQLATKMLIMPVILYLILGLLHLDPIMHMMLAILAALPANITLPVYAHMYQADEAFSVDINLLGTVFAIISIPIVYVVCSYIG